MKIKKMLFATSVAGIIVLSANGQKKGWQNLDLQKDSLFGISTEKAYTELLKNKKAQTVIVAIIDSGIDTVHEDLRDLLWTDSKTGIHGWNYIGTETGKEDVTHIVIDKKDFYDSLSYTEVPEKYRKEYQEYRRTTPALENKIAAMQKFISDLDKYDSKEARHLKELAAYHLIHGLNGLNTEPDTATGNSDISPDEIGPLEHPNQTPYHGTHVAGIIGAVRNNGIGMDGVADHVKLMILKVNGNIRELRDRSLAKAIRFASDHGAKVINISMGKPYSWDKKSVDEAVKYAAKKDVLIVHAAGNDQQNIDRLPNYPSPYYADSSGKAPNWITVGASRPYDDTVLVAAFSNFGKKNVDVFAPGTGIYSTLPGNKYDAWSGTSMAAPVVAGMAALIRGYYPKLTAIQVKEIIMQSVVKVDHKVYAMDNEVLQAVPLSELCVSGGVVNAFNAIKLAANYK